jgi:hypothetical protein
MMRLEGDVDSKLVADRTGCVGNVDLVWLIATEM